MRPSELITDIWKKTDLYYQRQICSPVTLLSGGIRFMQSDADIRVVPRRRGLKRQRGG